MKLEYIFACLIFATLLGMNYQSLRKFGIESESALANGLKNEVIKLEGSASIKKPQTDEQPLTVGTRVSSDDKIIKPQSSQVTILCNNGSLWYVPDGTSIVEDGCLTTNRTNNNNLRQLTNTNAY